MCNIKGGFKLTALAMAVFGSMSIVSPMAVADEFTEALTGGKPIVDIRYRYENVDQDGIASEADASTIRTRIGYETGSYMGFSFLAEMENTSRVGSDDYAPEKAGFPTVADPQDTELNRAYLQYANEETTVRAGRQRIILDNARFVGNVGWRQNEQTFDAFTIQNKSIENLTLYYGYIDQRISITNAKTEMGTHLLNASYSGLPIGTLTGFAYLIDTDNSGADTATYGLRLNGKQDLGNELKFLYDLSYATQKDYEENATNFDADYWLAEVGIGAEQGTIKLGYEVLGSDNGAVAFSTPLATLHKFQGWADKFLATPANGVEDMYIAAQTKVSGVVLKAIYHDFEADEGSADYGDEVDLLAVKKFGKHYTLGAKYASYDADTYLTDTDKFMVWGEVKF